jgi:hypothetical protein
MIGGRVRGATLAGVLLILLLALLFGLRPADPASADPSTAAARAAWLDGTARTAQSDLRRLAELLEAAVHDARSGGALTVAGDDPPAPPLNAAADRLDGGLQVAHDAELAITILRGTAAAVDPGLELPPSSMNRAALSSIAGQLRAAADAATSFVARRHATDAVLGDLGDALAALDRDQPQAALDSLARAAAPLELVRTWPSPPITLALWLTTTDALLAAVREMADASIADDPAAAEKAAADYAKAAEAARGADVSLALALSEGGAAVTAIPLRRLADGLADITALQESIGPLAGPG